MNHVIENAASIRIRPHSIFVHSVQIWGVYPSLFWVNISSLASNKLDIYLKPFSVNCLRPLDNIIAHDHGVFNINVGCTPVADQRTALKFLKLVIFMSFITHSAGEDAGGGATQASPPQKKKKMEIPTGESTRVGPPGGDQPRRD